MGIKLTTPSQESHALPTKLARHPSDLDFFFWPGDFYHTLKILKLVYLLSFLLHSFLLNPFITKNKRISITFTGHRLCTFKCFTWVIHLILTQPCKISSSCLPDEQTKAQRSKIPAPDRTASREARTPAQVVTFLTHAFSLCVISFPV